MSDLEAKDDRQPDILLKEAAIIIIIHFTVVETVVSLRFMANQTARIRVGMVGGTVVRRPASVPYPSPSLTARAHTPGNYQKTDIPS